MLSSPIVQEHASLKDLLKHPPVNPSSDVPQVQDGCSRVSAEGPLLQVSCRQAMEDRFFPFQELQQAQVGLWPVVHDGAGADGETAGVREPNDVGLEAAVRAQAAGGGEEVGGAWRVRPFG